MRIKCISINNFRSIKSTGDISLGTKSIIIGPNNEGKSNILQGLAIALTTIFGRDNTIRRMGSYRNRDDSLSYDWDRDFPLDMQEKESDGTTVFNIHFELSEQERTELSSISKIENIDSLSFSLTYYEKKKTVIVIKIGENEISVDRKKNLSEENISSEIIDYISDRFSFYYIPAIRPTEYSIRIIEELLEERLDILKQDDDYKEALKKISDCQKPLIDELSNQLTKNIKSFIPEIKNVKVSREEEISRLVSRDLSVFVEDNISTEIQQKGDGIKSLIAISLVNYLALNQSNKSIFLAIEEPESHLHPDAIHRLNSIIDSISKNQQVIITTHSPILIDRVCVENNILVRKNNAAPAENIEAIRKTIGVQVSDNLTNTRFVLLVEGKSDEIIIRKWLSSDAEIKQMLDNSVLSICTLTGGDNLGYHVSLYKSMLCDVMFFLDNDDCAKKAFEKAKEHNSLNETDGSFAELQGVTQSEIEDLIDVKVYSDKVKKEYGIDLNNQEFLSLTEKWSNNVKKLFYKHKIGWNQEKENDIKKIVSESVASYSNNGIKDGCSAPIDNLISIIKTRIK